MNLERNRKTYYGNVVVKKFPGSKSLCSNIQPYIDIDTYVTDYKKDVFKELIEFTRCRIYCFLSWNAYKYSGIFSMDLIEISTAKLCWQIQIEEYKMFHVYLKCFLFFVYFSVLLFMANFTQLLNLRCFRRKDFHKHKFIHIFLFFPLQDLS